VEGWGTYKILVDGNELDRVTSSRNGILQFTLTDWSSHTIELIPTNIPSAVLENVGAAITLASLAIVVVVAGVIITTIGRRETVHTEGRDLGITLKEIAIGLTILILLIWIISALSG
jgi:hypothetical protein